MPATTKTLPPALLTLLIYALLVVGAWLAGGRDLSRLVVAGDEFCDPAVVPGGLHVFADNSGYDGQYYFRLAHDPANWSPEAHGIRIDLPAYRSQRILYPLCGWLLSGGGSPASLPLALVLANLVALTLLAWQAAGWAVDHGRSAWWGLLVALYPGFVLSVLRDLPEPLEVALLVTALRAWGGGRLVPATLAGLGAVLAKETAVAGVAMLLAGHLLAKDPRRLGWLPPVLVLGLWLGWQFALREVFGVFPVRSGDSNLGPPAAGVLGFVRGLLADSSAHSAFYAGALGYLVLLGGLVVTRMHRQVLEPAGLAFVAYGGLGLVLTQAVWVEHWSFMRAMTEFGVLGGLLLIASASRAALGLAVASGVTWAAFAAAALT